MEINSMDDESGGTIHVLCSSSRFRHSIGSRFQLKKRNEVRPFVLVAPNGDNASRNEMSHNFRKMSGWMQIYSIMIRFDCNFTLLMTVIDDQYITKDEFLFVSLQSKKRDFSTSCTTRVPQGEITEASLVNLCARRELQRGRKIVLQNQNPQNAIPNYANAFEMNEFICIWIGECLAIAYGILPWPQIIIFFAFHMHICTLYVVLPHINLDKIDLDPHQAL